MASESTSNLRQEAVYNPHLPSNQCQQCHAVYNTKLLKGPICRTCYVVPENTTPIMIWAERFNLPSDIKESDYSCWQPGKRFEAAINKHVGNDCSGRGTSFFLRASGEFVTHGDVYREPISLMIDIPQGLADAFRENPDKVESFLLDLPKPFLTKWGYDLPSNGGIPRSQWLSEDLTAGNASGPKEYRESGSIMWR